MSPRFSLRLLAGQSDERLLALAREGHERAFEALVQRYRRALLRFCRRTMRLGDARAEDVVQHSLLKAWMALADGAEVHDFKPWLFSIVRNTALNTMRGPDVTVALTDAVRASASAASELEQRLEMRDALAHVAALPQGQREAIYLTAIDGQTHEEVASALGVSHGAVRGLLYRARTTLRSAAAALMPPPLIAWAAGSAGPSVEQVSSGAGALGAGGLLAKGAALAITAGALATGAVVQLSHSPAHGVQTARSAPVSTPVSTRAAARVRAPLTAASTRSLQAPPSSGAAPDTRPGAKVLASAPSHHLTERAHGPAARSEAGAPSAPTGIEAAPSPSSSTPSAPVASSAATSAEAPAPAQPQAPPVEEVKSEASAPSGSEHQDSGTEMCGTSSEPTRCPDG